VVVLGLPRGGVPVAEQVAQALGAPLDVFVVRKLGVPGREELAMGVLASSGVRVINPDVVQTMGITSEVLDEVTRHEQQELNRRERAYRDRRPPLDGLRRDHESGGRGLAATPSTGDRRGGFPLRPRKPAGSYRGWPTTS
jgi:predicted phosphoribosyltransferase